MKCLNCLIHLSDESQAPQCFVMIYLPRGLWWIKEWSSLPHRHTRPHTLPLTPSTHAKWINLFPNFLILFFRRLRVSQTNVKTDWTRRRRSWTAVRSWRRWEKNSALHLRYTHTPFPSSVSTPRPFSPLLFFHAMSLHYPLSLFMAEQHFLPLQCLQSLLRLLLCL